MNVKLKELKQVFEKMSLNTEVLDEWTFGGQVVDFEEHESNVCVLVKFEGEDESEVEYSFQRYFAGQPSVCGSFVETFPQTNKTLCSVDKSFFLKDAGKIVFDLLKAKYDY